MHAINLRQLTSTSVQIVLNIRSTQLLFTPLKTKHVCFI
jgi:hypothetical protein